MVQQNCQEETHSEAGANRKERVSVEILVGKRKNPNLQSKKMTQKPEKIPCLFSVT